MKNNVITITDINDARLDPYMRLSENQLARINEPAPGVFVAESTKVIARALEAGYEPVSFLMGESALNELESGIFGSGVSESRVPASGEPASGEPASGESVSEESVSEETVSGRSNSGELNTWIEGAQEAVIFLAGDELIRSMRGFEMTGGVLCVMKRKPITDAGELCSGMRRIAVLEDVENPTNVGAIFRSAAAFDIEAVLLTRDCADPLYRRSARVSMGNVFNIPWTYIDKVPDLHTHNFKIASMALREDNVCVDDARLKTEDRLAIVMGNENNGLRDETLAESDYVVKIPMSHNVDSLNVAAASAVAFWEICHNA